MHFERARRMFVLFVRRPCRVVQRVPWVFALPFRLSLYFLSITACFFPAFLLRVPQASSRAAGIF
jgi:hypothetical protein